MSDGTPVDAPAEGVHDPGVSDLAATTINSTHAYSGIAVESIRR